MKEKFLPWFLLFCALGLSGSAAYYSVVGLSVVFSGVAIPVIIMGSFLEISKIAIATYLHDKWKETYGVLKIYMTTALIILSIITSLGIYGLLSTGFQKNIAKLEINNKQVKNVELKKKRFEEIKDELNKEKINLDGDITKLRDGLSTNTTTQSVDRVTGQLITRANNANRKTFENQLKGAQVRRDTLSKKIDNMNDSVTKLDVDILNMESKEIDNSELGTIKYLSELLGWDIKRTANLFILILIFVFDPLAITLVIATNQAFKGKRKDENNYPVNVPQEDVDTPIKEDTDQVPTKYRPSTDEVKRVWERVKRLKDEGKLPPDPTEEEMMDEPTALAFTPYYDDYDDEETDQVDEHVENDTPIENYFEREDLIDLQKVEEQKEGDLTNEEVKEEQKVQVEPKRLSYVNKNGGSFRINRI